ncbi:MAG: AI-2E family transporter [Sphingobium sp.]|nr:AI-2E family transporter [Sphingobium sp.]
MTAKQEAENRSRRSNVIKLAVVLGLAALGLWMIAGFIHALIWAGIIAIAIDPLYEKFEHGKLGARHRTTLAALVTLTIALVLLVPIVIGISEAALDASAVIAWVEHAEQNGIPVPAWASQIPVVGHNLAAWWQTNLATPEGAQFRLHQFDPAYWLAQSRVIGAGVLHRVVIFAFTIIALFFLLRDRDSVVNQCRTAGERLLGSTSERILRQTVLSVRGTIDGLVLVGFGEGAVMAIVYVALGVPHPLLMGAITAVAAIIPFGAAVMFAIAAGTLLVQGAVVGALLVIVFGLIVLGIADHFIRPAMIGSATKLPFLWVLIGILGGVETFGLLGLFVGPATMAVLFMLWREFVQGPQTKPIA